MFDVVTIGTATLDVFLRSSAISVKDKNGGREICVRYGAKLEVEEIHFDAGGGGTNTAVTFARQGLKVATVVQIGDDFAGKMILEDLEKEGIYCGLIEVKKNIYTDYSTILWAGDGGRTILVYRGKTRLEVQNVQWEKLDTNWIYVSSLEGNLEILEKFKVQKPALSLSKGAKFKIAWNPGERELKQKEKLVSLLPGVTLFNVNKEEMEELVNNGQVTEIKELLKMAQELPCEYVVITDDRRGAYLWDRKNSTWWHSDIFKDSQRFETTGAGDSFGSGLVTGLIKGWEFKDCLWLAAANSSSVVSKIGAKKGILKSSELHNWPREVLTIEKVIL